MILTADQLCRAIGVKPDRAGLWVGPLNAAFEHFDITEPICIAAFLAQVGHESAKLSAVEENLNYSANGLMSVFPKYFDLEEANKYARNRKAIASRVYANRMGNGDEASGDGWKYRGKGLIQITGRENHRKCGEALGLPLLDEPDLLLEPVNAALSAAWYWDSRKLNALARRDDVRGLTRAINGGMNGFADRQLLHQLAKKALGV